MCDSQTMQVIEVITDLAVVAGVVFAVYNINSWRREHIGKREIELAEETLALFYQAKDAIHYVRHPASFGYETEEVKQQAGETDSNFKARKDASVVFYRLSKEHELFNRIHALRYRFMAQIGVAEVAPFAELRLLVGKIRTSASILARLWSRDHFRNDEQSKSHDEQVKQHEAVFWENYSAPDEVNVELDAIIKRIEQTCSRIIAGR